MKFLQYLQKLSPKLKAAYPLIISGLIGALISLGFFPIQKQIEQHYWNKQNKILLQQHIVEKRLELLDELIVEFTRYDWCSIRVFVMNSTKTLEEEPFVCYKDSSSKLLGITLKLKYYYDEDLVSKIDSFAEKIQAYEKVIDSAKSKKSEPQELRDSATEIIKLMQERLLFGIQQGAQND